MTAPPTAPPAPAPAAASHSDRAVRLLAAIRVALVAALTALVLAIAALAYVVSFEARRDTALIMLLLWQPPALESSRGRDTRSRRHPQPRAHPAPHPTEATR